MGSGKAGSEVHPATTKPTILYNLLGLQRSAGMERRVCSQRFGEPTLCDGRGAWCHWQDDAQLGCPTPAPRPWDLLTKLNWPPTFQASSPHLLWHPRVRGHHRAHHIKGREGLRRPLLDTEAQVLGLEACRPVLSSALGRGCRV